MTSVDLDFFNLKLNLKSIDLDLDYRGSERTDTDHSYCTEVGPIHR